ncbi:MAG: zinc-binding dehydrogenase [Deltaproteobacteria bacterium]|jgi:NADPH:quinone reductase-like Zn-dependent oxidoreductase|nr:zinc-binding dehydrogenase [Deltaproteobacteria bacterium]
MLHESIVAAPEVGPNKLLIEVKAAGVNPIDWERRKGNFRVVLDRTYPLKYAHAAHEYMEKGHALWKVVLTL